MKSAIRLAVLVLFAVMMLGIGGCKKGASIEEICEKFAPDDVADCVGDVTRHLEQCTNKDAVLECLGAAETEEALEPCMASCETAE